MPLRQQITNRLSVQEKTTSFRRLVQKKLTELRAAVELTRLRPVQPLRLEPLVEKLKRHQVQPVRQPASEARPVWAA
ncbi:MAG: hypothetical protein AAB111_09270, partial [Nitrospirota bacterium]